VSRVPSQLLQDLLTEVRRDPQVLGFIDSEFPGLADLVADEVAVLQEPAAPVDPWRNGLARPSQLLPGTKGSFSVRDDWRCWLLMGGRGCVAAGTLIGTPAGEVPVEKFRGGELYAVDPYGRVVVAVGSRSFRKGRARLYRVANARGDEIVVTDQHRFLTPSGWVRLADIDVGTVIAATPDVLSGSQRDVPRSSHTASNVVSIEPVGEDDFWDLTVPGYENYLADGFVNHNSGKSRAGAEAIRELLLGTEWNEPPRCALVSTTLDAVRIDMVEGQLFKVFGGMATEGGRIVQFNRSSVEMWLDNGAYLKGYSSERPSRLRGPNFHLSWCFPAGTPVTFPDGSLVPIEKIAVGDVVASAAGPATVSWSGLTRKTAEVWRLPHTGGNVDATPDHPVWVVGKGWVRLDQVQPGETLQDQEDGPTCVAAAFPLRAADVYDITTSTSEFYASGIRVHNCDEPAAWLDAHKAPSEDSTWSNMEFAVRMDDGGRWEPRIIATTTPKPVRLLRIRNEEDEHYPGVFDDPDTVISSMRTLDNVANLAETFRKRVVGRYDGTRLGAQELEGKLLDVAEGALWTPEAISQMRVPLHRILEPYARGTTVVAVDPSTGDGTGDECGIVVACRRLGDMGYNSEQIAVIDDASMRGRPSEWAKKVAEKYEEWNADYVIAETNQGGQLVREVLGRYSKNLPIRDVFAKRGKHLRAEPVALLSDQGQVKFAGSYPLLEDQMCLVGGTLVLTERGHVPIEEVTVGDSVLTRAGWAPVAWSGQTGVSADLTMVSHVEGCVVMTGCHPIFDSTSGKFVPARSVTASTRLLAEPRWASMARLSNTGGAGTTECQVGTSVTRKVSCSTDVSGAATTARSLTGSLSTTSITTPGTTRSATLPWSPQENTPLSTIGRPASPAVRPLARPGGTSGLDGHRRSAAVRAAKPPTGPGGLAPSSAQASAGSAPTAAVPVYNLMVETGHLPEFFADGVLVHNCTFEPDKSRKSPDRLDAFVYATLFLMPAKQVSMELVSRRTSGTVKYRK